MVSVNRLRKVFPPPFGILLNTMAAHGISVMKVTISWGSTNSRTGQSDHGIHIPVMREELCPSTGLREEGAPPNPEAPRL